MTLVETASLSRLLPTLVRRELRHGLPPCPYSHKHQAAVLLADFRGFTNLSERLSTDLRAGAEELSLILNSQLEHVIRIAQKHGGDILKFAGDGVLTAWTDGTPSLTGCVQHAASCALEMQSSLAERGFDDEQMPLRIGIAAGEVVIMHLPVSARRREIVISGSAILQLAGIESRIGTGEVVLTNAAWLHVADATVVESRENAVLLRKLGHVIPGNEQTSSGSAPATVSLSPRKEPPDDLDGVKDGEEIWPYIPENILQRVRAGQHDWLNELRTLTAVFVKVPGLTHAVSAYHADQMLSPVLSSVERYGGEINNISSDEKGISVLIVFGLPPAAHEDDPARAVSAALHIAAGLAERGFLGSVGVATGRAFCGLVGSGSRVQYTVLGDVVNRAIGLMMASSDGVLCDRATRRAVGDRFNFAPFPEIQMKGRSARVEAHRPVKDADRRTTGSLPLIGRLAEIRHLNQRLELLRKSGGGGLILIEGEAGIGKSRLLEEVIRAATAMELRTIVSAGDAIESVTPFFPWRTILSEVLRASDGDQTIEERILEAVRDDFGQVEHACLLNPLLGTTFASNPVAEAMDAGSRASNLLQLLAKILTSLLPRPSLLILEDVHWMDSASWQLVREASARVPELLVVMTRRPRGPGEVNQPDHPSVTEEIRLFALSRDETRSLLKEGSEHGIDDVIADLIYSRSEGNPFFTQELFHSLQESRTDDPRNPAAPSAAELAAPQSVQGVIISRIDRLAPGAQLCLKVASVIGRAFSLELLKAVYPLETELDELPKYLRELTARGLIRYDGPSEDDSFRFHHAITQEATYSLLPPSQLCRIHRSVAEWYQSRGSAELPQLYPVLVHHWRGAGDDERLLHYLDRAGNQALLSGAYQEAVGYLAEAEKLANADADRRSEEWLLASAVRDRQLGEAYYSLGRLISSHAALSRMLAKLDRPLPANRVALVARIVGELARHFGQRFFGRSRPSGEGRAAYLQLCLAYERLSELSLFLGHNLSIFHAVLRNLNLAERSGAVAQVARSSAHLAAVIDMVPLHGLARRYEHRALKLAASTQEIAAQAHVFQAIGLSSLGLAQLQKSQDYLARAAEMFLSISYRRKWSECLTLANTAALNRGDLDFCAATVERILPVAIQSGGIQAERWFRYNGSRLYFYRGRFEEALVEINAATSSPTLGDDVSDTLRFNSLKAMILLRLGHEKEAFEVTRPLVERAAEIRSLACYAFHGFAELAEVLLQFSAANYDLGVSSRALFSEAEEVANGLRRFARIFPLARPASLRLDGIIAARQKHSRRAMSRLQRSARIAERLRMPLALGHANLSIGRELDLADRDRAFHFQKALEIFERTGTPHWSADARRSMEDLHQ